MLRTTIEVIIQTFLAFFAILFFARILGKQQISQLTFYDYINGITFGSIAATLATDVEQKTLQHLIGLFLFACLTYLMSYISLKSRPLRKILEGEPVILIHNGKILEKNLAKSRYNLDNLTSELRQQGVFNIEDVEFAVLETNGILSILKKPEKQPLTPQDLNLKGQPQTITSEIIEDGQIVWQNLKQNGLDEKWLMDVLKTHNISSIKEVAFASFDPISRKLYIDKYDDNLTHIIDLSDFEKK